MCKSYEPLTEKESESVRHHNVIADRDHYELAKSMIGFAVQKRSNRPFKSGNRVNTCSGIGRNPNTNLWGLLFHEDDSIVDVKQCIILIS